MDKRRDSDKLRTGEDTMEFGEAATSVEVRSLS
jgi:hypothetical protein